MDSQLIGPNYLANRANLIKPLTNKVDILAMSRHEIKYVLTKEQLDYMKISLSNHMQVDEYGKTSIASLYYDTPDYRLIRTSIEKPAYKEKIRLRSYGLAKEDSRVFLELKRKVSGYVYKRRIALKENEAHLLFESGEVKDNQIAKEINYFTSFYKNLVPVFLIIYDRIAYFDPNSDLRLTLDENPRYRTNELNLHTSMEGEPLLKDGGAILEIKVQGAMPLWLTNILSNKKIYQSSFSKVGEAYQKEMLKSIERKL